MRSILVFRMFNVLFASLKAAIKDDPPVKRKAYKYGRELKEKMQNNLSELIPSGYSGCCLT